MRAAAKRDMVARVASRGVDEYRVVVIGRRQRSKNIGAGGDGLAGDLGVFQGDAPPTGLW